MATPSPVASVKAIYAWGRKPSDPSKIVDVYKVGLSGRMNGNPFSRMTETYRSCDWDAQPKKTPQQALKDMIFCPLHPNLEGSSFAFVTNANKMESCMLSALKKVDPPFKNGKSSKGCGITEWRKEECAGAAGIQKKAEKCAENTQGVTFIPHEPAVPKVGEYYYGLERLGAVYVYYVAGLETILGWKIGATNAFRPMMRAFNGAGEKRLALVENKAIQNRFKQGKNSKYLNKRKYFWKLLRTCKSWSMNDGFASVMEKAAVEKCLHTNTSPGWKKSHGEWHTFPKEYDHDNFCQSLTTTLKNCLQKIDGAEELAPDVDVQLLESLSLCSASDKKASCFSLEADSDAKDAPAAISKFLLRMPNDTAHPFLSDFSGDVTSFLVGDTFGISDVTVEPVDMVPFPGGVQLLSPRRILFKSIQRQFREIFGIPPVSSSAASSLGKSILDIVTKEITVMLTKLPTQILYGNPIVLFGKYSTLWFDSTNTDCLRFDLDTSFKGKKPSTDSHGIKKKVRKQLEWARLELDLNLRLEVPISLTGIGNLLFKDSEIWKKMTAIISSVTKLLSDIRRTQTKNPFSPPKVKTFKIPNTITLDVSTSVAIPASVMGRLVRNGKVQGKLLKLTSKILTVMRRFAAKGAIVRDQLATWVTKARLMLKHKAKEFTRKALNSASGRAAARLAKAAGLKFAARVAIKLVPGLNILSLGWDIYDLTQALLPLADAFIDPNCQSSAYENLGTRDPNSEVAKAQRRNWWDSWVAKVSAAQISDFKTRVFNSAHQLMCSTTSTLKIINQFIKRSINEGNNVIGALARGQPYRQQVPAQVEESERRLGDQFVCSPSIRGHWAILLDITRVTEKSQISSLFRGYDTPGPLGTPFPPDISSRINRKLALTGGIQPFLLELSKFPAVFMKQNRKGINIHLAPMTTQLIPVSIDAPLIFMGTKIFMLRFSSRIQPSLLNIVVQVHAMLQNGDGYYFSQRLGLLSQQSKFIQIPLPGNAPLFPRHLNIALMNMAPLLDRVNNIETQVEIYETGGCLQGLTRSAYGTCVCSSQDPEGKFSPVSMPAGWRDCLSTTTHTPAWRHWYSESVQHGRHICSCEPVSCEANEYWQEGSKIGEECKACPSGSFRGSQLPTSHGKGLSDAETLWHYSPFHCIRCEDVLAFSTLEWANTLEENKEPPLGTPRPITGDRPVCRCKIQHTQPIRWRRPQDLKVGQYQFVNTLLAGSRGSYVAACAYPCNNVGDTKREEWSSMECRHDENSKRFPYPPFSRGNLEYCLPQQVPTVDSNEEHCAFFDVTTRLCNQITCKRGESLDYMRFQGDYLEKIPGTTCSPCDSVIKGSISRDCWCVCPSDTRLIRKRKAPREPFCGRCAENQIVWNFYCTCRPNAGLQPVSGNAEQCECVNRRRRYSASEQKCICYGNQREDGSSCKCPPRMKFYDNRSPPCGCLPNSGLTMNNGNCVCQHQNRKWDQSKKKCVCLPNHKEQSNGDCKYVKRTSLNDNAMRKCVEDNMKLLTYRYYPRGVGVACCCPPFADKTVQANNKIYCCSAKHVLNAGGLEQFCYVSLSPYASPAARCKEKLNACSNGVASGNFKMQNECRDVMNACGIPTSGWREDDPDDVWCPEHGLSIEGHCLSDVEL